MSVALILLLATLPLAGIGWAAAVIADRLKIDAVMRGRLWLAAVLAPLALAPAFPLGWAAHALTPSAMTAASPQVIMLVTPPQPATAYVSQPAPVRPRPPSAALVVAALAIGALARLGLLAARLARAARLRSLALRQEAPILDEELKAQADRLGVKAPALRPWDGSQSVLVGLRRPAILLPRGLAGELDRTRLGLILAHELGHLRARDPWRMMLAELAGSVLWFNPFTRLSLAALAQVREEICDAVVLAGADRPTRRVYAETLMSALRVQVGASPALAFTGARRRALRRMAAILRPAAGSARRAVLCAGGASVALTGGLGGLAYGAAGILPAPVLPKAGLASPTPSPGAPRIAQLAARGAAARSISVTMPVGDSASGLAGATKSAIISQAQARLERIQSLYDQRVATRSELDAAQTALVLAQRDATTSPADRAAANQARLELARTQLVRQQALYDQGVAPQSKVDEAWAELVRAEQETGLASDQASLSEAQVQLTRMQSLYGQGVVSRSTLDEAQQKVNTLQLAQAQPSQVTVTPRPPAVYTNADWSSVPTAAQIAAAYPSRAAEAGIGGAATLVCQVSGAGLVSSCRVTAQSPPGEGFGEAALKLQQFFRMRPKLDGSGEPVAGTVTIPLRFNPPAAAPLAQSASQPAEVARTSRPPAVYTPSRLIAQPTEAKGASVYPPRAATDGIGGAATLDCQTDVEGKVFNCRVKAESPLGEGFGAAALRLQKYFAVTPKLRDGHPIPDSVTIPLQFSPPQLATAAR